MGDDLENEQEEEQEREKEQKRWQGYASALLIALTVLFAGTVIGLPAVAKEVVFFAIISIGFGLVAIVSTVLWFALEYKHEIWGRPTSLVVASCCLGTQATSLFIALAKSYLAC